VKLIDYNFKTSDKTFRLIKARRHLSFISKFRDTAAMIRGKHYDRTLHTLKIPNFHLKFLS